jgi:dienelactone hydrolase
VIASVWRTGLTAVLISCACVGIGWSVRQLLVARSFSVPIPSGPHPVERARFLWRDPNRAREISVVLWSPASGSTQKQPLLLLSPAMGHTPENYSVIAADLASYGYIVAGVTPTQSAPIDLERRVEMQPLVESWVDDIRFALDQVAREPGLRERVDHNKIGVFGHSFGGAAAMYALRIDPRFRRAANLDGAPQGKPVTGLSRPLLIVWGAPLPPSQKKLNNTILGEIEAVCASNAGGCQIEDRPEARHMNFSDAGLSPSPIPLLRSHQDLADIDGKAFLYSIASLLRTFFDAM